MGRTLCRVVFPLVCLLGCVSFAQATPEYYSLQVFNGYVSGLDMGIQVIDAGPGKVDFVFYNESTIKSSIAQVYFDDDALLLSTVDVIGGAGTSFERDASPGNLPGGKSLPQNFIADFSFGVAAPPPVNGINPGEQAVFRFGLSGGADIGDVESALGNGTLRIGEHVIALPGGTSVSAVNDVPLPATFVLFGFGSALLRTFGRKTGNRACPVQQLSYPGYGGKQ